MTKTAWCSACVVYKNVLNNPKVSLYASIVNVSIRQRPVRILVLLPAIFLEGATAPLAPLCRWPCIFLALFLNIFLPNLVLFD